MEQMPVVRVLAISGSLRRISSNRALVNAAAQLAPAGVEVSIYAGLDSLPGFNPDLDTDVPPSAVGEFRAALQACDAVLFSVPEYAQGVPGAFKNALDWVVGSGELVDKPVALVNASRRASHAWASVVETLTVMSARVIRAASITVPLDGTRLDAEGIAANPHLAGLLRSALEQLALNSGRVPHYSIARARPQDLPHLPQIPPALRARVQDEARRGLDPDRRVVMQWLCDRAVPVSEHAASDDLQFLEEQINEYNFATTGIRDARDLAIVLRDADDRIYAGLSGHTWGGVAEVRFLWVDEPRRHTGLASRLLRAAEQEALARGCRKVVLSTHSFQAPGFYSRHGYVAAGEFSDYPLGHSSLFLEKRLA